ncbi:MAG TPA: septal ring lytic transglycosylase RlpA family protein [Gammaproteobacteria bacterium]|nr:septal ring lytic transglycosylase RlpA family protein [Gammaproteobacteria bacterium]
MMRHYFGSLVMISVMLTSCAVRDGAPDSFNPDPSKIRNARPANEPLSRYGNPPSYTVNGETYYVLKSSEGFVQSGEASWYGTKFHGKKTSSGEPYDMYAMTAAHKTLPLPSYVEVTRTDTGKKLIVKVNDRGPFHPGRIIDLSYAAAHKLGIAGSGTAPVEIRTIDTSGLDLNTTTVVLPPAENNNGQIHVQVAAMGSEQAAEDLASSLRSKQFNSVRIFMTRDNGKNFYRVRIGPIPNTDLAYQVLAELKNIGMGEAKVVLD